MEFDLENPLVNSEEDDDEDDTNRLLFSVESDQMPQTIFLESLTTNDFLVSFRREALSFMSQAYYSGNLDWSVLYLATNYVDRFIITRQDLPLPKPWMWRLVVLACVSLASKMKNLEFSAREFQGEEGLTFDARTIQKMELVVLDALDWRMRSVTPLSFTRFFISRLELEGPSMAQDLKDRATNIIFKSQKEIRLIGFRPSVVAAAALLVASHGLFPSLFPSFKRSILSCKNVNNDNLLRCLSIMQEMVEMEGRDEASVAFDSLTMCTRTPSTVLDWPESRDVLPEKRRIKRRRINDRVSDDGTVNFQPFE